MIKKILIHVLYGVILTTLTSAGCNNNDDCWSQHSVDVYLQYSADALAEACSPATVSLCNNLVNWSNDIQQDVGPSRFIGPMTSQYEDCDIGQGAPGSDFLWNTNTVIQNTGALGDCYAAFNINDEINTTITCTSYSDCGLCVNGARSTWRIRQTLRNGVSAASIRLDLNYEPNVNYIGCQ